VVASVPVVNGAPQEMPPLQPQPPLPPQHVELQVATFAESFRTYFYHDEKF
jgi:hypothetical protein